MSWSLPYSRDRRYLTGMDWILGTLDYTARKRIGLGGFSQVILDLDGHVAPEPLIAALNQISRRFPLIHGQPARDWLNLAPYWKVPRQNDLTPIPLKIAEVGEDDVERAERLFNDYINKPFESESQHLRLMLIHLGSRRSRLGMVFDHRLLDAFGAETLYRLIDYASQGRLEEFAPLVKQTEPAHLDEWPRRFASGRTVNRYLRRLNEKSVRAFKMPPPGPRHRLCFLHEALTTDETTAFNARSIEEIGIPLALPSAAARAMAAICKVVPSPPLPGDQWLIFTSASARMLGQEWEKLFFNQFSMMSFSSGVQSPEPSPQITLNFRDQVFEQMKLNIPFVLQDASALARIGPLWLTSRLMPLFCDGRFCSFYFACLRDSGFTAETFLGIPLTNITHKPLVFAPPGLNICMTTYAARFNLVVSYVEGAIPHASARQLLNEFKQELLR